MKRSGQKTIRQAAAALCAAAFFLGAAGISSAAQLAPPPQVSAKSAALLDGTTGECLYVKNGEQRALIASTTKIMTGLLVCEAGELDRTVTVPDAAVGLEGSSMYLKKDETLTRRDLLYGMMLHSGNDAALTLAISVSGSEAAFVRQMNLRARALGLTQTHFANPHGLDSGENYSTALDLAHLAQAALQNAQLRAVVSTKTAVCAGRTLTNHNKLLWRYDGCIGVKTGYTRHAGRILVSAAERDGRCSSPSLSRTRTTGATTLRFWTTALPFLGATRRLSAEQEDRMEEERLQKILARCAGVSRRRAEELIAAGRVRVNGNTAQLGEQADAEEDVIELDGTRVKTRQEPQPVYLMLCKPRGFVTTMHDEKGRRSVAELVADVPERVYPVGRLDYNSEGLLLMTNDGVLANALMHPKKSIDKTYLVWVSGYIAGKEQSLSQSIEIDGRKTSPAAVQLLHKAGTTALFRVTIHEGRNRQIRRLCERAELTVTRLRRVQEGQLTLGDLKPGQHRPLTETELRAIFEEIQK